MTGIRCLLAIGRSVSRAAIRGTAGAHALGGFVVRAIIPLYRAWWTIRRVSARARYHGVGMLLYALSSRATVYAAFTIAVLVVAAQSLHAREYGGFVGERALLSVLIEQNAPESVEETVEGLAVRPSLPSFRIASVHASVQPIVLGAEATAAAPLTSNFSVLQPVLTDDAVTDDGRAGIEGYAVESGDTPSTIAERFGLATETILWENKLQPWSLIQPGETLRILPVDGVTHTIQRGETLERIAERYRADAEEILEENRLVDADDLTIGDLLIIPGGRPPQVIAPPRPKPTAIVRKPQLPIPTVAGKFLWPSAGGYRISQYFTWRHHAIDIAIPLGTPVFASEPANVVSSGWISGYGYQVLLEHDNGIRTRYAHNSRLLVRKGQRVERGETIALVGSTGRSTGPHIHYEVFVNGTRVNPLQYLR